MKLLRAITSISIALLLVTSYSEVKAVNWTGAGANDLWSNPDNWDTGVVPNSATEQHNPPAPPSNDGNVARNQSNGTNILIDSTVNAAAFGVQIGHPIDGTLGNQAASNTLTMTGGTLTTQGNFLFNIGRGRNADPTQLVQFNMSGGVVNAAGITIPEAFNPNNVLGFTSVGINAEMHVSGNSVINTDLLRLGAQDANSLVVISDNARINLTDDNNGFANGVLWIEAFENPVIGTSLLDIRDNALMTIHGEWWTDENNNGVRDLATMTELQYFRDNYVAAGWIVANGGADPVQSWFEDDVIYFAAQRLQQSVPEPTITALLALGVLSAGFARRRRTH